MDKFEPPIFSRRSLLVAAAAACNSWRLPDVDVTFDISDSRSPAYFCLRSPDAVRAASLEGVERFLRDIRACHSRHPLLTMIGICGWMYHRDLEAAGTYQRNGGYVFATTSGDPSRASDRVHHILHHEYSSLLIHAGLVDIRSWRKLSTPKAYIGKRSIQRMYAEDSLSIKERESGFLTIYARSSPENDFNTYAQWIMTDRLSLNEVAAKYPKIAAKRDFVEAIYAELGLL